MKKGDMGLIIVALFAAFIALYLYFGMSGGSFAIISAGGVEVARMDLNQDVERIIESGDGVNVVRVKDGAVYMEEADCPDGLCMRQPPISKEGQTIVCLPNRVIVEIKGAEKSPYDAISS